MVQPCSTCKWYITDKLGRDDNVLVCSLGNSQVNYGCIKHFPVDRLTIAMEDINGRLFHLTQLTALKILQDNESDGKIPECHRQSLIAFTEGVDPQGVAE